MKKITKAIFSVAGIGGRFLPATKASPKTILPIVDKPLCQFALEEAAAAGTATILWQDTDHGGRGQCQYHCRSSTD